DVAAPDLDVLVHRRLRLHAHLPGHHTVPAGVDRSGRHVNGPRPLLVAGQLAVQDVPGPEPLVGAVGVGLARVAHGVGAAHCDDLAYLARVAAGHLPGVDAAQAPADQGDGTPRPFGMIENGPGQAGQHRL